MLVARICGRRALRPRVLKKKERNLEIACGNDCA